MKRGSGALEIAVSTVDITPKNRRALVGYIARKSLGRVNGENTLQASITALRKAGSTTPTVILIAIDTLFIDQAFVRDLALRLGQPKLKSRILAIASHTHGAPNLQDRDFMQCPKDTQYRNSVLDDLASAAKALITVTTAWKEVQDIRYKSAHFDRLVCRRKQGLYVDFRAKRLRWGCHFGQNVAGVTDPFVRSIEIRDSQGIRAVWWSFPAHAAFFPDPTLTNADFPGHVRKRLRSRYPDATIAFLPGLCGSVICNAHVGAIAHKVMPANAALIDDLPALLRAQGEPFGTTSIYAQFRVMKLAAEAGVKVMLDGQGADELLGGYAPYLSARVLSLLKAGKFRQAMGLFQAAPNWAAASKKAVLADLVKYAMPRALTRYMRRWASGRKPYDWITPELIRKAQIFTPGATVAGPSESYLKRTLLEATTHYGLPELLRYEDRNSMHVSLESRVPFLTAEFAEMCMSLPESSLVDHQGRTKSVLRDALAGFMPEAILERRDKIGFRPDISGMNQAIVGHFLMDAPGLALPAGLDWDVILKRLSEMPERDFGQSWIWRVVNLAYWHDMVQKHPVLASGNFKK